jgi:RNA polymerase sigma factor (sigma-70 family)
LDSDTSAMGDEVRFQTTRWNLVQSAHDVKALDALITIYWKPLYFFIRRYGYDNETSKDIVQEFLTTLIERGAFGKADPQRGRFRTFLLTALSNFLKDWAKAATREKRGGGRPTLSLDFANGEKEYARQVNQDEAPEAALNRAWARSMWEQSVSEIKADPAHRQAFRLYLDHGDFKAIAEQTGLSEAAAQSAVHRLKGQLRDIIVGHIRETVSSDADLKAEVAEFMSLLQS